MIIGWGIIRWFQYLDVLRGSYKKFTWWYVADVSKENCMFFDLESRTLLVAQIIILLVSLMLLVDVLGDTSCAV